MDLPSQTSPLSFSPSKAWPLSSPFHPPISLLPFSKPLTSMCPAATAVMRGVKPAVEASKAVAWAPL